MSKSTKTKTGLKIAYLAWGSLLLPANVKKLSLATKFTQKGPEMPLELSRINSKGRLTLVINENSGKANQVFCAMSKHNTVNKAFNEFAKAEEIGPNLVGVVDLAKKQVSESATRNSATAMEIAKWAKKNNIDVCIFPAYTTKFKDVIDVKFSPNAVVNYLNNLPPQQRNVSLQYVKNIPKTITTPTTELIEETFE